MVPTRSKKNNKRRSSKTRTRKRRLTNKSRTFYTHHNGNRPYKVDVNRKLVKIYTLPKDFPFDKIPKGSEYTVLVKTYDNIKRVFIGNSVPGDDMYLSYRNNSKKAKKEGRGNSLLLQITKNKYVFVGHIIVEFSTKEQIKEYHSMIGNNDVPYPLAIGKDNIYFMITKRDDGTIPYSLLESFEGFPKTHSWALDGYSKLWGINEFKDSGVKKSDIRELKDAKMVHSSF